MAESAQFRARGRINLIGEHTDYNDGFVLPLAIAAGCTATVTARADAQIAVSSKQRDDAVLLDVGDVNPAAPWVGGPDQWAAYAVGTAWALAELGHTPAVPVGFEIAIDSDVPIGAGLSSSAAVGCSSAAALSALFGLGLDSREVAEVATYAETRFVGAPTGGMDQLAAALGEQDHLLFCDMRTQEVRLVPFDPATDGLTLLVIDTRARHTHVDGAYGGRRGECEAAAKALGVRALRDVCVDDLDAALARLDSAVLRRRVRHVVTENRRVLETVNRLEASRLPTIGHLLTASHRSMADDFEITVAEVDVAVDTLLAAGALGARMTGGGFGGCVIALVDRRHVGTCVEAVRRTFAVYDFAEPAWFEARASAGLVGS